MVSIGGNMGKAQAVAVGLILTAALGGCSAAAPVSVKSTPAEARLLTAVHGCNMITADVGVALGNSNSTLVLQTEGNEVAGMSYENALCVLKATKISDAELNLITTTRALDGRQTGSWNDFEATWSYHPDRGLNLTLVDTK